MFIFEESSIFHNISLIHQYPLWNIHMAIHYDIIFHIAWIYPSIISIHIPLIAHFISQFYIHSYPIMGLWNIHLSIVEWSRFHSIPFIYLNIYISISIFEISINIQLYHLCIYIYIYIYQLYPFISIIHYPLWRNILHWRCRYAAAAHLGCCHLSLPPCSGAVRRARAEVAGDVYRRGG